nr:fatty acyl-AMP ligase [Pseudomonas sp. BIGb0427]
MAESTLFVTGVPQGVTPLTLTLDKAQLNLDRAVLVDAQHAGPQSIHFVSSGVPAQSCQVRVVDPQRCVALADDLVGEIWVSSPSVSGGYRNRPQLSQEVLQATLEGEPQRRFLRTGDLGFMHQGELFVTGRRKDLIIIDGKNHYPTTLNRPSKAPSPS